MLIYVRIVLTRIDTHNVGNQGQQLNKSFRNANNNEYHKVVLSIIIFIK